MCKVILLTAVQIKNTIGRINPLENHVSLAALIYINIIIIYLKISCHPVAVFIMHVHKYEIKIP